GAIASSTDFSYDTDGNLLSQTDGLGNVTASSYDAAGRQTSLTRAAGTAEAGTERASYDNAGRGGRPEGRLGSGAPFGYHRPGQPDQPGGLRLGGHQPRPDAQLAL